MKKIVKGNDFTLKIPVMKMVEGQAKAFPLPACTDIVVQVCNQFKRIPLAFEIDVKEDNVLLAKVEGDKMSIGTYAIEVKGKIFGNDWRSNEYPQFAIVSNNADADTEFGETDEGDNSVEMDTAMVILPPSVELSDLIDKANEVIKTTEATNTTLNENEDARKEAEAGRVAAEQEREKNERERFLNELKREEAEESRTEAESDRVIAERTRTGAENTRQDNELVRKDNEGKRVAAEQERVKAEEARVSAEGSRANAETERVSAEKQRVSAENERVNAESSRSSAEAERVKAEKKRQTDTDTAIQSLNTHRTEFDDAEAARVKAENARVEAENARQQAETDRASAESERVKAEKARADAEIKRKSDFDAAIKVAEDATAGAETCTVELSGSTISVTNRHGETKSVDVINTDEEVTVTIASSVNSIKVTGIKINVFLNNGKTPQTYTTNADGKVTFTIDRGNYYQVVFPEYGNAQPIAPQGYTAVLGSRSINVEYLPYDEDTSEKVIVNVQKCGNDNECAAWEGMPVTITFDGKDSVVNTDSNGQVVAFVPFGKEYTVKVEDKDGYNVSYNRNVRTFKAEMPKRIVAYKLYKFRAGVLIIDANRNEYYLDEWIAAGRNADDAVAIKIADANLAINNSAFCIKTADMKNTAQLKRKAWCVQNTLFNSIVSIGDEMKDENYYRGNTSSYLVRQEAQERSLIVPAFDYAYSTTLVLGGEELRGFIMSIGQENAHVANIESIKEILTSLFSADIAATYYNFVKHNKRWTSAQNGNTSAYYYYSKQEGFNLKQIENFVLPAYPC